MKSFLASLICLILLAVPAAAEETIVKFSSDVTVNQDASLDVIESISVLADGSTIRHGIFRDFPTRYIDKNGVAMRVDFSVQNVTRNGQSEPFVIESISDGTRVKIGDKDVFIEPGGHKYIINYHTTRQLGFFEKYDELYWNVTGNGWPYTIQYADVKIHLPSGAEINNSALYTGVIGSKGADAELLSASGNEFSARLTRVLQPSEGFTVAAAWQKGIVAAPTAAQQRLWMLRDNAGFGGLGLTLLGVIGYFLYAWNKVGRDPPTGTIIPLFHPPENLGPAAVRYIWKQKFDDRAMAANLVGLAVKGRLKIENDGGEFALTPLETLSQALTPVEKISSKLLPSSSLNLSQTYHSAIAAMKTGLESYLEDQYKGQLFENNLGWLSIGIVLSILGLAISAILVPDGLGLAGLMVGGFVSIFWAIALALGWASVKGLISSSGFFGKLKSILALVFLVPFVGAGIAIPTAFSLTETLSSALVVFIIATITLGLINVLFAFLMPAPTVAGRKVLDAIEGFRLYMTTAEEKRLDLLNPPEKTPQLFERYLPYAMALDCENAWNTKFAAVLAAAAAAGVAGGSGALWYYGSGRNSDWGSMTKDLGNSLSSTLASSSVAPGSSSGSSGGGSSGGGGGGGGGGGW